MRGARLGARSRLAAATCCAGLTLAWTTLAGSPLVQDTAPEAQEPPIHKRIDLPSISACGGCHLEVYREWSESLHAKAWTNDNVRAATRDFQKRGCRPCHSPMPALISGLEREPDYRDFNQDDGVHCLSCHGLEDGVAAARTIEDAPCRPRFEPRLLSADHCYPCHQPTHGAFDEYRTSDAFAVGIRCVDCHMPERGDRPGRSHGPHGGMSAEFVQRAIAWECETTPEGVRVSVRNRAAHKFPGEIPSRSFYVRVSEGQGAEPQILQLRKPHRREERADNRLLPDETRVFEFTLRDPSSAVVELLFQPLPLLPLDDSFLLGRWSAAGER